MPMPVLPPVAALRSIGSGALLIGAARIDRSGRIHERALLHAVGWGPGQRLELDSVDGLIVIAPAPAGRHIIDRRSGLPLPAAVRRMCGIKPGPPLVLAAAVADQVLVIHAAATVARLLAAHYTDLLTQACEGNTPARSPSGSVHCDLGGSDLQGGDDAD
jgi:hypothetical protein